MKIAIAYPPLLNHTKVPLLSQNRQFQWIKSRFLAYYIYPVIPASAASLLKSKGYDVYWLDGIAQGQTFEQWLRKLIKVSPELIAFEVKTPVIKNYWKIIDLIKKKIPSIQVVLMGDHVTALPRESLENSKADFVICGGDYDFGLLSIVQYLDEKKNLDSGIWYKEKYGNKILIKNSGDFRLARSLDELPLIDRDLTDWRSYAFKNSNFFRAPGAYTMFGRDCWWGKCTFCSWTTLFPGEKFRSVSVKNAIKEVENLVENYKVKEIMDDSGSFPTGKWLRDFCHELIKRGYSKKIKINCNMRFNSSLTKEDYKLMGKAGFRFILYGLESVNSKTLKKINKNLETKQIVQALTWAKEAGLWPHITVMVGYPWEGEKEVTATIEYVKDLFKKGLVDTMQATIVIPYPGTPLFKECKKMGLLKTFDWNRYDMTEPIIKTKISEEKLLCAVRDLYSASIWNKTFILNTLRHLKNFEGIKYVSFQGFKYLGKLLEFS